MDFNHIFRTVGHFGAFQWSVTGLLCMVSFLSSEIIWANFILYRMEHFCHVEALQDLPYAMQRHIAIPMEKARPPVALYTAIQYSECLMYNLNYSSYSEDDFLRWNRTALDNAPTIQCSAWTYEQGVMHSSAVSQFNLVCASEWKNELASSLTIIGSTLGAIICGTIADRFGRQKGLLTGLVIKLIGAMVSALTTNYNLFLIGRFVQGLGTTAVYQTAFVILLEFSGPTHRNLAGLAFACSYSMGIMSIAGVAYFVRSYSLFMFIMSVPLVLILIYPTLIPESPQWLLLQGRKQDAARVMREIAQVNNKPLPAGFDLSEIQEYYDKQIENTHLSDLFRTPRMRSRTFILLFCWFAASLMFYTLSLCAGSLGGDVFITHLMLALVEIPATLICMWLVERRRMGRRWTSVSSFLTAGTACMAGILAIILRCAPIVITALSLIAKAGSSAVFNLMYIYSSELFPTEIRNTGVGVCNTFALLIGTAAPYVANSLITLWPPLPPLIIGVVAISAGILSGFLPETLGKQLPDTIVQIENRPRDDNQSSLELSVSEDDHVKSLTGKSNLAFEPPEPSFL